MHRKIQYSMIRYQKGDLKGALEKMAEEATHVESRGWTLIGEQIVESEHSIVLVFAKGLVAANTASLVGE